MDDLLGRCEWPPLPPHYEKALRECVGFLLGRFDVTAILACGTIVRGIPDASSDLDVYVLHRGNIMQRLSKFFNGVPTEMFVNPYGQVLRHFETGRKARRPDTAHMIAHGFPVLDVAGEVEPLRAMAIKILKGRPSIDDRQLTQERYRAATLFEDARDVQNRDPETAAMILGEAVGLMLDYCFSRERTYFPRKKSLFEMLAAIDPDTANLARRFYGSTDLAIRFELAGLIADRTIEASGFFEWEGTPVEVES